MSVSSNNSSDTELPDALDDAGHSVPSTTAPSRPPAGPPLSGHSLRSYSQAKSAMRQQIKDAVMWTKGHAQSEGLTVLLTESKDFLKSLQRPLESDLEHEFEVWKDTVSAVGQDSLCKMPFDTSVHGDLKSIHATVSGLTFALDDMSKAQKEHQSLYCLISSDWLPAPSQTDSEIYRVLHKAMRDNEKDKLYKFRWEGRSGHEKALGLLTQCALHVPETHRHMRVPIAISRQVLQDEVTRRETATTQRSVDPTAD